MFSHVMLGCSDRERSRNSTMRRSARSGYARPQDFGKSDWWMTQAARSASASRSMASRAAIGNGSTIGFARDSPEAVDAWHAAGIANGGHVDRGSARAPRWRASARCTSLICAIPTATNCAAFTGFRRSEPGDRFSEIRAHGGRQLVVQACIDRDRHRHDLLDLLAAAADQAAKLPVVWYLSGLTCTHANVTDKGEYRAACAELGLIFVAPDTSPRGEGVPDDRRPMISGRARASTSTRPRTLARQFPHVDLCHGGAAGVGRGRISGRRGAAGASSAIRWAGMAP